MQNSTKKDPHNHLNHFGHLYDGEKSLDGYGVCTLCGCIENTDKAASDCRNDRSRWCVSMINKNGKSKFIANMVAADNSEQACEIVRERSGISKNVQLIAEMH